VRNGELVIAVRNSTGRGLKRWRQLIQGLTLTLIPYPVYSNRLERGLYSVDRFIGFYKQ
jgi:hypothetical protein